MKKISSLLIVAAILCISLCSCSLVKSPEYYELVDKDKVPSLTKVVGDRKVESSQVSKQYVKYVYKDVSDTKEDVKKYASYLVDSENFKTSQRFTNLESSGEIELRKTSPTDGDYYITVKIKWTESKITVEADRTSEFAG